MMYLLLLPAIAMFCVFIVCATMLPRKLSVWLLLKNIWFSKKNPFDPLMPPTHVKWPKNIPLISCEFCLTFWISLIYLYLHTGIFEAVILSGATAFLTSPLKKLL